LIAVAGIPCDGVRYSGRMADYPATIARRVEHEIEIKRSRFITHLEPVGSVAEADEFIAGIRKRYWDARATRHGPPTTGSPRAPRACR
jgi:hypothetical protein